MDEGLRVEDGGYGDVSEHDGDVECVFVLRRVFVGTKRRVLLDELHHRCSDQTNNSHGNPASNRIRRHDRRRKGNEFYRDNMQRHNNKNSNRNQSV